MPINEDVIYIRKGETKTIQLRTTGILKKNKKNISYRDISNHRRKYHVLEDGVKRYCKGKTCKYCKEGNKPFNYYLIPILYHNAQYELLTNFSLHHILAKHVTAIENAGQLPNLYKFKITKKETGYYNVELIKPPVYQEPTASIKNIFKDKYSKLTKKELKEIKEFDDMLETDKKYATKTDWIDYLTKAKCHGGLAFNETRAKFIYERYITSNRFKKELKK